MKTSQDSTATDSLLCRRQRRAATAPMAVGYQLLHLIGELPVGAIVVADDFGHPLAHAGDAELATILAESVMWSPFCDQDNAGASGVDELTLRRIQARYPEVEGRHVVSFAIDTADARGARVVAVGDAARAAVTRATVGIARICAEAANDNTRVSFFDPSAPVPERLSGPVTPASDKEVGVRWVIGASCGR